MATKNNTLSNFKEILHKFSEDTLAQIKNRAKTPSGEEPSKPQNNVVSGKVAELEIIANSLVGITSFITGSNTLSLSSKPASLVNLTRKAALDTQRNIKDLKSSINTIRDNQIVVKNITDASAEIIGAINSSAKITEKIVHAIEENAVGGTNSEATLRLIIKGLTKASVDSLVKLGQLDLKDTNFGKLDLEGFVNGLHSLQKLNELKGLDFSFITDDYIANFNNFLLFADEVNKNSILMNNASAAFSTIIPDVAPFVDSIKQMANNLKELDADYIIGAFDELSNLATALRKNDYSNLEDTLKDVITLTTFCATIANTISDNFKEFLILNFLSSTFETAVEILVDSTNAITKALIQDTDSVAIKSAIEKLNELSLFYGSIGTICKSVSSLAGWYMLAIPSAAIAYVAIRAIISVSQLVEKFDDNKLKANILKAEQIGVLFDSIAHALQIYKAAASLSMLTIGSAQAIQEALIYLSGVFGILETDFTNDRMKTVSDNMKNVAKLIIAITGTFALAAIGGTIALFAWKPMLAFAAGLYLFIHFTSIACAMSTADMETGIKNLTQFNYLILAASSTLLLGAAMGALAAVEIIPLGIFIVAVMAFTTGMIYAVRYGTKDMEDAIPNMTEIAKLVFVCGGVLAAAAALGPVSLLAIPFAITLGLFVTLMSAVAESLSKKMDKIDGKSLEEFEKYVAIMGGILMLGAAVMLIPGMLIAALEFSGVLTLFVAAVTGAFVGVTKFLGDKGLKEAEHFALLVGIAGGILLLAGSMISYDKSILMNSIKFAGLFAGFIFAVGLAFALANKIFDMSKSAKTMLGMSALIVSAGATMMLASHFYKTMNWGDVFKFIGGVALFIGSVALMCAILGRYATNIKKGMLTMLAIEALVVLGGLTLLALTKTIDAAGGWESIAISTAVFIGAIGAIALGVAALGAAWLPVIIGLGVLALIEVALYSFAVIVDRLADSMIKVKELEGFDVAGVQTAIADYFKIFDKVDAGPMTLAKIAAVSLVASSIAHTMSELAKGVKDMSSLVIPTYDANGKKNGVTRLTYADFENAGKNTSILITTLGSALMNAYAEHADWFEDNSIAGMFGLSSGRNTKFGLMVSASEGMASLISKISKAIASVSKLRIEDYDADGKPLGTYRVLKETDFTQAGTNVSKIISTLGESIIGVAEAHPEIFNDSTLLGKFGLSRGANTTFGRVVSAMSNMSQLITSSANAVVQVANMRLNEYDAAGNVIGVRELDGEDFKKVGESVDKILTTLGYSVIAVAEAHPEIFEDNTLLGKIGFSRGENTPFGRVVSAMGNLGSLVLDAANAVEQVSKMKLTNSKQVSQKIATILTTVGNAIIETYNGSQKLFDDASLLGKIGIHLDSNSPYKRVQDAIAGSGKMVSDAVEAIKVANDTYNEVGNFKATRDHIWAILTLFPQFSAEIKKRYSKAEDIKDTVKSLTSTASSYMLLFKQFKKIFETVKQIDALSTNAEEIIDNVKKSVNKMADAIVEMNATINQAFTSSVTKQKIAIEDAYSQLNVPKTNPVETLIESFDRLQKTAAATTEQSIKKVGDSAENINSYVKAINSLDVEKATTMTDMFATMAKFSSDNANSMIRVVNKLVVEFNNILGAFRQELNDTRNIINSADSIQRRREDAIDKAIERVNKLMKDPIVVKVIEEQEQNAQEDQSMFDGVNDFFNKIKGIASRGDSAQHAPQSTTPVTSPSTSSDSNTPQSSPGANAVTNNPYVLQTPWNTGGQLSFSTQMDIDGEAQRGNTGRKLK